MIARASCTDICAWHVALTELDNGDLDGALAIYEQHIKPAGRPYPPLNIFTDGASLLWRLSLAGKTGLDPHWRDVAAYGEKYFPQAGAHFADVHFALAGAATGSEALDTRLAQLEAAPPTASWRRAAPRSSCVAASGRSPKATMRARSACSNRRFPNWRGSAAATRSANYGKIH